MKLYSENKNYKLYHGDMNELNSVIENNSIDCVITDPPYELGFMGKGWDASGVAFRKETWKHCYDVLKPGGYLLAFGGSRTFHRIACAIEDAGFEIRDTICWLYGCYSADTQVLTDSGWKYFYELNKTEKVLQWDKDTNKLSWIKPLNYFEYDVDDELKLFENRHISQLVTKNHKVAVSTKERRKQYGDYHLVEASDLKKSWQLKFPMAGELDGKIKEQDAYIIGWWLTDAWAHNDGKAIMFSQCKQKTLVKLKSYLDSHDIKYSEYIKKSKNPNHNDEHIFYVTGDIASKLLSEYPTRELNWGMLNWDKQSRELLLEGLMDGDGSYRDNEYAKTFWSKNKERCDIVQAICLSLNYRTYLNYKDNEVSGVNFNIAHNSTETQSKHRKADVKYCGKVYCLQTETGAFVVRRNGKAFISGNSGFPKSMNLGLAIDKKNGVESEVVGNYGTMPDFHDVGKKQEEISGINKRSFGQVEDAERTEYKIYKAQNEWNGWGTCLKPSFEPIIIARKPCEGTTTDNVLKYGVGGLNIDECRVESSDEDIAKLNKMWDREWTTTYDDFVNSNGGSSSGFRNKNSTKCENRGLTGRFPANTILTYDESDYDEVCGGFPVGGKNGTITKEYEKNAQIYGKYDKVLPFNAYDDEGSASRYFYCAKASKRDRDEGLEEFETKQCVGGGGGIGDYLDDVNSCSGKFGSEKAPHKNNHPCVKPTALLEYLIRLVAPKGATILDPFMGSGSTGKAVMYENNDRNKDYKFIGIELTDEYLPIAKARIDYAITDKETIDKTMPTIETKAEVKKNDFERFSWEV